MTQMERTESAAVSDRALLERSRHLALLRDALSVVLGEDRGALVLLSGEAGVGKTALLQRFCAERGSSKPILWGGCDPLFTPRPLGPFMDIAQHSTGGALRALLEGAKPQQVRVESSRAAYSVAPRLLSFTSMPLAARTELVDRNRATAARDGIRRRAKAQTDLAREQYLPASSRWLRDVPAAGFRASR